VEDCIFCKIIAGEIPSYKIYEDDHSFAFLDISPIARGHTLVVSKTHVEFLSDMDPDDIGEMFKAVGKVGDSIQKNLKPAGINYLVNQGKAAGQLIPHVHCHVIPKNEGEGLDYTWGKADVSEEEMKEIAERIKI
jgi:histidine triad (HIT) family protein